MSAEAKRKLKIKTGAINRYATVRAYAHRLIVSVLASLVKEFESYKKEATTQGEKVKKLKEGGADPYDVKKQVAPRGC